MRSQLSIVDRPQFVTLRHVDTPTGLGQRVLTLRDNLGLSQDELAARIDVDRSYISRIENGHTKMPSMDVLRSLARALGTTTNDLLEAAGHEVSTIPVRSAEDLAREFLVALAREKESAPLRVREVTDPGSAGPPGYAEPEYWSYWPRDHERGHQFIAVAVVGDCLLSRVRPGERLIVDQDASPRTGDIVVARHDGGMLVKEFRKVNGVAFLASETLPPIAVNETTVILGVVVAITRRP